MVKGNTWLVFVIGIIALWTGVGPVTDCDAQRLPEWRWGVYDGLSISRVGSLHQDYTGRIWIGTDLGLNFLNNERLIVNHKRLPNLPGTFIQSITSSPDGTIWAGSHRLDRVCRASGSEIQVDTFSVDFSPPSERHSVISMAVDHQERVWFYARIWNFFLGERLYCLENGKVSDVTRRYFVNPNQQFRGIKADWKNRRVLLVTIDGRLWELRDAKLRVLKSLSGVDQLDVDSAGQIYALTGTGLYRIERERVVKVFDLPVPLSQILRWSVGRGGELVFQKANGYVFWYDGRSLSATRLYVKVIIDASKNIVSTLNQLLIDRQGNIWAGTGEGLIFIQRNGWQSYSSAENWNGLSGSVSEDKTGTVWFSTWGNGLFRLKENTIVPDSTYISTVRTKNFYPSTHRDADGNLFFSTVAQGTMRFDGKDYQLLSGTHEGGLGSVSSGFYDDKPKNRYLLSTRKGLHLYNRQTLTLDSVISVIPFSGNDFFAIEKDRFGRFWVGGREMTMIWDERKNQIVDLLTLNPESSLKTVFDIQRDRRGNLWFATSEGLWLYDYNHYQRVVADQLNRRVLYCRPFGRFLLIGTIDGFFVFDVERFYEKGQEWIAFFDRENGFSGSQCIPNGIWLDASRRLWVVTLDRIMVITEQQLKTLLIPVQTGIHSIQDALSGEVYFPQKNVTFNPDQRELVIRLLEPDPHNQFANSTYAYRLERLDEEESTPEWSTAFRTSSFVLRNLSRGHYRLTVNALRSEGLWNTRPFIQEFWIAPPFWATWWFRMVFVLSIVSSFFYWRLHRVRRQAFQQQRVFETHRRLAQLELESATQQRQDAKMRQELAEASRQRALLEVKAISNQIDPHFISNFLTAIQAVIYKHDVKMVVTYLAKFGVIFRSQLMSRTKVFWTLLDELNFVQNYLELEQLRFGERIRFVLDVDPTVSTNTNLPKMLIQGYVSNAIKHGLEHKPEGGTIWVRIYQTNSCLRIEVEDDGVGLVQAKQYRHRSTGRGLSINEAIFDQLNQYNVVKSWQRMVDLTDKEAGISGVRMEALLPIHPILPPEEIIIDKSA